MRALRFAPIAVVIGVSVLMAVLSRGRLIWWAALLLLAGVLYSGSFLFFPRTRRRLLDPELQRQVDRSIDKSTPFDDPYIV